VLLLLLLLPGPCSFTTTAFRQTDLTQPAASYIIAPHGPTLCGQGQYAVPTGEAWLPLKLQPQCSVEISTVSVSHAQHEQKNTNVTWGPASQCSATPGSLSMNVASFDL
jgi:hypothetical protein